MTQSLFDSAKVDLEPDGALRDIYILNTTTSDWHSILGVLSSYSNVRFQVNGSPAAFPDSANQVLAIRPNASPLMNIDIGGLDIACHFFDASEVEFDFVPNQVATSKEFEALLSFVQRLGNACGKAVLVTPENGREFPFLRFNPAVGLTEYVECSSA